jgi:predicted nucleic acid-binding protein
VIPVEYSGHALEKIEIWLSTDVELVAPALWSYEAVSAIRKYVFAGSLTQEEASAAIVYLSEIGVRVVEPTLDLHLAALKWAEHLKDFVAYDPAYIAVAEQSNTDFWTADAKLVTKTRALGIDWIHHISDTT